MCVAMCIVSVFLPRDNGADLWRLDASERWWCDDIVL